MEGRCRSVVGRLDCASGSRAVLSLLLGSLAAVLSTVTPLFAQTCVPEAFGVPYNPGPPIWWTASEDRFDDPRWRGSVALTYGAGTDGEVEFQALFKGDLVYLSWDMKVNPGFHGDEDLMQVVFGSIAGTPAVGDPDVRIRLFPLFKPGPTKPPQTTPAVAEEVRFWIDVRESLGGNWRQLDPSEHPDWLTSTARVWVSDGSNTRWVLQMRVPVVGSAAQIPAAGIGIDASNTIRMWYETQTRFDSEPIAYYSWPRGVHSTPDPNSTPLNYWDLLVPDIPTTIAGCDQDPADPRPCYWKTLGGAAVEAAVAPLRLLRPPTDPSTCSDVGVSLTWDNVGTLEPPDSRIYYGSGDTNTFFARPHNNSGIALDPNTIKASFRIANWGSQPVDGGEFQVIPELNQVPNSLLIPNGTLAAQTAIQKPWVVGEPWLSKFNNGDLTKHQCFLVELVTDLPITLINKSVYRNMDFVSASKFERPAEISVVGLEPLSPTTPGRVNLISFTIVSFII